MRKILINDVDFTNRVELGYSFVEKLDRELDEGQVVIPFTSQRTPFKMWSTVKIFDDEELIFDSFISSDYVTLSSFSDSLFRHEISLVEPTKYLERRIVKGKTFRQPTQEGFGTFYTLADVLEILAKTTPLQTFDEKQSKESKTAFFIDPDLKTELENISSPEFTFRDVTLREAVDEVASVVDSIARLSTSGFLTFDKFNEIKELFDVQPQAITAEHDINDYNTTIYSDVLNAVSENNEEIYPSKDLYTTLRSDGFLFDFGANGKIPTNKPIYKVNKVEVRQKLRILVNDVVTEELTIDVPITDRIVEKTLWDALPTSVVDASLTNVDLVKEENLFKDNTFFFEYGKKNINVGQTFGLFDLRTTLDFVITISAIPKLKEMGLIPQTMDRSKQFLFDNQIFDIVVPTTGEESLNSFLGVFGQAASATGNLLCRVYYEPIPKSLSFDIFRDDISEVDFYTEIVGNQKLRVVDINNYIKNAKSRVNRIGNSELQISHRVKELSEAQNIGDFTIGNNGRPEFIVTKREVIAEKDHYEINYELNKNFNKISQFIGLNQEIRQYEIEQEGRSTERSLVHTTFIQIDAVTEGFGSNNNFTLVKNDKILDTFDPNLSSNKPLTVLRAVADENVATAVTAGLNPSKGSNIVSLSFEFDTNASAGQQKTEVVNLDEQQTPWFSKIFEIIPDALSPNRYFLVPSPYTNDDGRFENLRVKISENIDLSSPTREEYVLLGNDMPQAPSWDADDPHYNANFHVMKDAAERLLFNIQFNFVAKEYGKVYIGDNLAQKNMILSNQPNNNLIIKAYNDVVFTERDKFSVAHLQGDILSPNITIDKANNRIIINNNLSSYDSYAIVDDDDVPFLLVNSNNPIITFDINNTRSQVLYLISTFLILSSSKSLSITLDADILVFEEDNQALPITASLDISLEANIDKFEEDNQTLPSTASIGITLESDIDKFEEDNQTLPLTASVSMSLNDDISKIEQDNQTENKTKNISIQLTPSIQKRQDQSLTRTPSVEISLNEVIVKFQLDNQTLPRTSSISITLDADITKFEQQPTVTATFDSAGGTPTYASQSGESPLSVTDPGSPTRSGFTFGGWSPSLPTTITQNTTFTAQWNPIDDKTLTSTPSVSITLEPDITKFEAELTATPTVTVPEFRPADSAFFEVLNNDSSSVNVTWNLRRGGISGTIIANGDLNIAGNGTGNVGVDISNESSNTFCLTDVIATASGKSASNPTSACEFFTVGGGGGCYLTTAMVNYYGYDDDGIELNSMRAVRSYMIENGSKKYITMLKQYAEESNAIVEYIEQQENKEDYYQEIKDVVLQVTQYVNEGKLSEATEYYWEYYLKIKQEVGG